ncbi:flavin reductase [Faecalicatena fissicatena]|uniref:Flavin reductase n=1 Tax=Faecalicatena fissicatena TaxID=290055 RepID=A0ABS2E4P6_9FIRM|nr:flavin reductase [Faecalicatena fissicatena]MBM6736595.1 flavin reductase [Faecalicatena fissicatena]HIX99830.1 flavin reductase [Candidatus Dorea intestinigallinarum]
MDMTAMFKLSYGLFVVTAKEGEKDNGCITNTAGQVTDTPNRITLTVNKGNYTHDMILRTGVFNVSILSEKASFDTFKHFGFQSGRDVDKFADYAAAERSANGLYYITEGTNAYLSAKVVDTMDLGTHTLFLADVTDGEVLDGAASATYAYYHSSIKPAPAKEKKTGWRCKICGYIYEGEELPADFTCPVCKHGAADFEKI